jgi:hypothetical protein
MYLRYSYVTARCRDLDAPDPRAPSSVLKLNAVNHGPRLPAVFRGKTGQMILENIRDICTQQILPPLRTLRRRFL